MLLNNNNGLYTIEDVKNRFKEPTKEEKQLEEKIKEMKDFDNRITIYFKVILLTLLFSLIVETIKQVV